ncbi:MAG: hypothetical protein ACRDQZ_23405 [Mycobacteriales bacterium]
MALALSPLYPVPDRSKQPVCRTKDEDGVLDLRWCDGVMTDGRAFRAELWAQDGVTALTAFFSTVGLENCDPDQIKQLVLDEGIASFRPGSKQSVAALKYVDDAGQELWSVNVVVGDEDETFVDKSVPFFSYASGENANSMFNPLAARARRSSA